MDGRAPLWTILAVVPLLLAGCLNAPLAFTTQPADEPPRMPTSRIAVEPSVLDDRIAVYVHLDVLDPFPYRDRGGGNPKWTVRIYNGNQ